MYIWNVSMVKMDLNRKNKRKYKKYQREEVQSILRKASENSIEMKGNMAADCSLSKWINQ